MNVLYSFLGGGDADKNKRERRSYWRFENFLKGGRAGFDAGL
jgi:hypothetical protein